jgi:hypothetical protein
MRSYVLATGSALLAAAAMMWVGCGEAGGGDTASAELGLHEAPPASCNSITAHNKKNALACYRSSCEAGDEVCKALTANFKKFQACAMETQGPPPHEFNGLPGGNAWVSDEGELKHIGEVFCTALCSCGLATPVQRVCEPYGFACE